MDQHRHLCVTTGKTLALTIGVFVGKAMPLLFNMLSRFVIIFLPRNNISYLSIMHVFIHPSMYLLSIYVYVHYLLLSIRIFPPTSSLEIIAYYYYCQVYF